MESLKTKIRSVPDFPKPGILFYDITTLLNDPQGFRDMIDALAKPFAGQEVEQVVGIESRGFILGAAVANTLNAGFVPIRKPGKLPSKTHREDEVERKDSDGCGAGRVRPCVHPVGPKSYIGSTRRLAGASSTRCKLRSRYPSRARSSADRAPAS